MRRTFHRLFAALVILPLSAPQPAVSQPAGPRFTDVTTQAGINFRHVSTPEKRYIVESMSGGVALFDYDNDGFLDIYLVNSLTVDIVKSKGKTRSVLYRNRGDGTFDDVSVSAGIAKHIGKGMSVAIADYDHDGDVDAFVTNDTVPNFLFRNNGDGTFAETALTAGVAVPESGRPISGMGVDFQDYDNDGWEDIHMTGISGETFPLFRNESATRPGTFADATASSGIA